MMLVFVVVIFGVVMALVRTVFVFVSVSAMPSVPVSEHMHGHKK
jgi:hypothetical protein